MARRAIRPQDEFGGRRPPAAPEWRRPCGPYPGCGRDWRRRKRAVAGTCRNK